MEKYVEICEGKAVIVTDKKNILDIRELREGKRFLVHISFEEGEK